MLCGDELAGVITAVTFETGRRFTADQARLYARARAVAGVVIEQSRRLRALERDSSSGAAEGSAREARVRQRFERLLEERGSRIADVEALLAALERLLRA